MESVDSNNVEFILDQMIENSGIDYNKFLLRPTKDSYNVFLKGTNNTFQAKKEKALYRVTTIPRVNNDTLLPPDQLRSVMEDWLTKLKDSLDINVNQNKSFEASAQKEFLNIKDHKANADIDDQKPSSQNEEVGGWVYNDWGTSFSISNESVKAVIGVREQAFLFAEIITNFSPDEKGMFIGLFGRWGRGKTFFWKILKDEIKELLRTAKPGVNDFTENIRRAKSEVDQIIPIEFHAWKYQDTPAVWAYLYEVLADRYYKVPIEKGGVIRSIWRRVWLGYKRNGWKLLFVFIISAIIAYTLSLFDYKSIFDNYFKMNESGNSFISDGTGLNWLIPISGSLIPLISWFYKNRKKQAKDIFNKYFNKITYKQLLGIQAEIQKEISFLLKAWIGKNRVGKEKILLFVDDIDRCSEEKIIQIIDSIKVMLDDEEISKRLIVVAAIDENILKRAIQHKYCHLVEKDITVVMEEKPKQIKILTREYIDKLFVIGIKLGELNEAERVEILENFSDGKVGNDSALNLDILFSEEDAGSLNDSEKEPGKEDTEVTEPNFSRRNLFPGNHDFEVSKYELERIKQLLSLYQEATPRTIRIFYYRYLLAKNLKDIELSNKPDLREAYEVEDLRELLPLLIIKYSSHEYPDELIEYRKQVYSQEQEEVEIEIYGKKFLAKKRPTSNTSQDN